MAPRLAQNKFNSLKYKYKYILRGPLKKGIVLLKGTEKRIGKQKMAMKKGLWIVVIVMLVVSSRFCFVHSRVLRSEASKEEVADNCEDLKGADSSLGMVSFVVSSDKSNTRPSKRSLAFRLASGPSKKGRGH